MATATVRIADREYGLIDPEIARTMSGLELLRALVAGKLLPPPITGTLGYKISSVED